MKYTVKIIREKSVFQNWLSVAFKSHCLSYRDSMSAEGSMEDEPLSIRDSPTLPEEAENSGNAVNDESNKGQP